MEIGGSGGWSGEKHGSSGKNLKSQFSLEITQKELSLEREDEWMWRDEKVEVYTVKLVYKTLQNSYRGDDTDLYILYWKMKVLS